MLHGDAITSDSEPEPEPADSDDDELMHPIRKRNRAARRSKQPGAADIDQLGIGQPDAVQPEQPADPEQPEGALALRINLNLDNKLYISKHLLSIA